MYKRLSIGRPSKRKSKPPRTFFKLFGKTSGRHKKGRVKKILAIRNLLFFLEKRERFAIQTIILTGGVLTTQLIWQEVRFYMVLLLAILSYLLSVWSLKEDIKGNEWILLFILPVLFTASLSLFYFLLPPRWIIRLTTTIIFAVGTYAIMLVENIYNVAVIRSIQLLRAAQSVGLLLTLIVVFLSANIIYSLKLNFLINFLTLTVLSFLLALQSLWSIQLNKNFNKKLFIYSLIVGIGVGELGLGLSFWPIENASFSLFIAAGFYSLTGIIQQYLGERLFVNVIREYIIVFIFTFILTFLTTKWG